MDDFNDLACSLCRLCYFLSTLACKIVAVCNFETNGGKFCLCATGADVGTCSIFQVCKRGFFYPVLLIHVVFRCDNVSSSSKTSHVRLKHMCDTRVDGGFICDAQKFYFHKLSASQIIARFVMSKKA